MVDVDLRAHVPWLPRVKTPEELAARVAACRHCVVGSNRWTPFSVPSPSLTLRLADQKARDIEYWQHLKDPGERERYLMRALPELASLRADVERNQRAGFEPADFDHIYLACDRHAVDLSAADQVVTISAQHSVSRLNRFLQPYGQCLPMSAEHLPEPLSWILPLRDAIGLNLPHMLEAQCGSWRDWILEAKVMLADGSVAKSGSKAVKSVAGYDLHKLLIGARGTLAVLVEVTLRTFPLANLPDVDGFLSKGPRLSPPRKNLWIQRTLRSDFKRALEAAGDAVFAADLASATLWAQAPPEQDLPRYDGDWVLRSHAGAKNLQITDPTLIKFMKRAKEIFDPERKLNPGEMGIF